VSVGEVLHVYLTPDSDFPIAPAGVQKAPGVTIRIAVGDAVTVAVGLGKGLEVVEALGEEVGLWDSEAVGVGDAATGSNCFV
jgi:hypothetical protein